jgi:hypothetical protein
MDSLWIIIILALMSDETNNNNRVNYLDEYKKFGDDEDV